MKFRNSFLLFLCMTFFLSAAGCNTSRPETKNSSSSVSQVLSSSSLPVAVSAPNVSSEPASSATQTVSKAESQNSQNNSDWVAYDTNKDGYKLHIRKKDGSEDKVIVDDIVLAPCVAGEWVYYFPNLDEIGKVRLDGSQKTKVCCTDAMVLGGNIVVTSEYRDGYILYKTVQLREVEDNGPNTVAYYKLDLSRNKITEVTDQFASEAIQK